MPIIQIDLKEPFEKSVTLFSGLSEIAQFSVDPLAPGIQKKCDEILVLIQEVKSLLKA
jgi:hypothetical protein